MHENLSFITSANENYYLGTAKIVKTEWVPILKSIIFLDDTIMINNIAITVSRFKLPIKEEITIDLV